MNFDVKAIKQDHVLQLRLSGKIDVLSAPKLEQTFLAEAEGATEDV